MSKFREVEFKYLVPNITPSEFVSTMLLHFKTKSIIQNEGTDYFFHTNKKGRILRVRESSDSYELTVKNPSSYYEWARAEIDLPLSKDMHLEDIKEFMGELDYTYHYSLNKQYFIIKINNAVISLYTAGGKQYLEIEADKDSNLNFNQEKNMIVNLERFLSNNLSEDINKDSRLTHNLYELHMPTEGL